jgi:hypothetical protein
MNPELATPHRPRGAQPRRTLHVSESAEILSWYSPDNPGTKAQLARMLNHGVLDGGTGRMGFSGRPGIRARSGALLRAQRRGLRSRAITS